MKRAFTISETLTVLMIVGIIAAMTIPILMSGVQSQKTEAALKKLYSSYTVNIKQSLSGMDRDGGYQCDSLSCLRAWGNVDGVNHLNILDEQIGTHEHNGILANTRIFNIDSEDPGALNSSDVWPNTSDEIKINVSNKRPSFYTLRNTHAVIVYDYTGNCNTAIKNSAESGAGDFQACGFVIFDTNGRKAPNLPCRDRFAFYLANEPFDPSAFNQNLKPGYLVPVGYHVTDNDYSGNNGFDCTAKVLANNWKIK